MRTVGLRVPLMWRGHGWKGGNEEIQRFRPTLFDGDLRTVPNLPLRSAFSDAICLLDPACNAKLVKDRSLGRIGFVAQVQ